MSKFELLSVAEDNHKTDCMSGRQNQNYHNWKSNLTGNQTLYISVDRDRKLTVNVDSDLEKHAGHAVFRNIDIDGLIEYLQDVKTFLSEEDMYRKLAGLTA